jgi:hypothetical protein
LSGEGYLFYDAMHSEFDKNTLRRHDINLLIAVDALGAFYNYQLELEHGYDRFKPIKINFGALTKKQSPIARWGFVTNSCFLTLKFKSSSFVPSSF